MTTGPVYEIKHDLPNGSTSTIRARLDAYDPEAGIAIFSYGGGSFVARQDDDGRWYAGGQEISIYRVVSTRRR